MELMAKGFKSIESKIEKLAEIIDPPEQELIIVNLIERYTDEGNDMIQIAIKPDTRESFLAIEEDEPFDFS
jgi:hypothetical protein